jgi:hypothetical protein
MSSIMVHDYSKVDKHDLVVHDFSKVEEYKVSGEDAIRIIDKILDGALDHNYCFYSEDNKCCLLDLS